MGTVVVKIELDTVRVRKALTDLEEAFDNLDIAAKEVNEAMEEFKASKGEN